MKLEGFLSKLAAILLMLSIQISGYSQAPQGFAYQAIIRNSSGTPIASQGVKVHILLTNQMGTTTHYGEEHTLTTSPQGAVNIIIGEGNNKVGTFAAVPWQNGDIYIKVEVDPTGSSGYQSMGSPVKLQSVPYALYSPNGMLPIGSAGQTLFHNGTAWTPSNVLVNNGTNIGIGSALFTPTQNLDVNGAIRLRGLLYDYNNLSGSTNQILTRSASGLLWQNPSSIGVPAGTGLNNQLAIWSGTNSVKGISNLSWGTNLQVTSLTTAGPDDPIMEVRNRTGLVVFAVYQSGVRIFVDGLQAKGAKGGFAVGGLTSKATSDYFLITPDSARIRMKDPVKGAKGGFAVGGMTSKGPSNSYLQLLPDNYFIGQDAGKRIQKGQYNIFIGYQAGANTSGFHDDMFPTDGDNNIFLGYRAGFSNTTGEQNMYLGAFSGEMNVNGESNTFVGAESGRNNTGYGNTLIGAQTGNAAQANNTGYKNTFIGHWSGSNNTTGNGNVFIGRECGSSNTTGADNVYIGHLAGHDNTTGAGNIFIGSKAGWSYSGSNKLIINNADVVDEATSSLIFGDFSNKTLRLNSNVGINFAPQSTYALTLGLDANDTYALVAYGNTYCSSGTWAGSDIRFKTNISTINNGLDKIMKLRGVNFEWKTKEFPKYGFPEGKTIGVIAQEIEQVIPEVVNSGPDGYKSVAYDKLTVILIEAVKEQQKQIESLKAELEAIKALLKK